MAGIRALLGKGRRRAVDVLRTTRYGAYAFLFPGRSTLLCPCCGLRYRSFVPGHFQDRPERYDAARYEGMRQDVICPVCGSLPRHRILATWCERRLEVLQASSILYFAPEPSMMRWMRRHGVRCTTADLMAGGTDLTLDIQATGLPGESYDIIIANHVLEHVVDFRRALAEVRRILRPEGMFVCSFPMDPKVDLLVEDPGVETDDERRRRYGQVDHMRLFGMGAPRFLREAGFLVEEIGATECPDEILPVVGPADYDINRLFVCRKGSGV